jgi:hypothetical protein
MTDTLVRVRDWLAESVVLLVPRVLMVSFVVLALIGLAKEIKGGLNES